MARVNNTSISIVLFFLLACSSCTPVQPVHGSDKDIAIATEFFKKSTKERISDFNNFDLETQYYLYIYGNQSVHPPAIYLAEPLAKGGVAVANLLKRKLMGADDVTIRDIVLVFKEMSKIGSYNVAKDADLMKQLYANVNRIKNQDWRRISLDDLKQIEMSEQR